MQISVRWLEEWVDIGPDASVLAEDLTLAGLEVSAVKEIKPLSPKIVVGKDSLDPRFPTWKKVSSRKFRRRWARPTRSYLLRSPKHSNGR